MKSHFGKWNREKNWGGWIEFEVMWVFWVSPSEIEINVSAGEGKISLSLKNLYLTLSRRHSGSIIKVFVVMADFIEVNKVQTLGNDSLFSLSSFQRFL